MIKGGCLCGAVRYVLSEQSLGTTVCHCRDCQKASGSPAMAWTFFRQKSLEWSLAKPAEATIAGRVRSFCRECGTPLKFYDPNLPQIFEISTCSLDEPYRFPPENQCWVADRIPWFPEIDGFSSFHQDAPLPADS